MEMTAAGMAMVVVTIDKTVTADNHMESFVTDVPLADQTLVLEMIVGITAVVETPVPVNQCLP